jgi:hypothetical protein
MVFGSWVGTRDLVLVIVNRSLYLVIYGDLNIVYINPSSTYIYENLYRE